MSPAWQHPQIYKLSTSGYKLGTQSICPDYPWSYYLLGCTCFPSQVVRLHVHSVNPAPLTVKQYFWDHTVNYVNKNSLNKGDKFFVLFLFFKPEFSSEQSHGELCQRSLTQGMNKRCQSWTYFILKAWRYSNLRNTHVFLQTLWTAVVTPLCLLLSVCTHTEPN